MLNMSLKIKAGSVSSHRCYYLWSNDKTSCSPLSNERYHCNKTALLTFNFNKITSHVKKTMLYYAVNILVWAKIVIFIHIISIQGLEISMYLISSASGWYRSQSRLVETNTCRLNSSGLQGQFPCGNFKTNASISWVYMALIITSNLLKIIF